MNKDMLVENLKEKSLVNQRIVYDAIRSVGGHLNVEISKEMIQKCRGARAALEDEVKRQKKRKTTPRKKSSDRRSGN